MLFFSTGIISTARIHPQPAFFFHHRDYLYRPFSSPACSFLPQGLSRPPRSIPSLLFSSAGIISTGQIHPQLALFLHKDDFFRPDDTVQSFFLCARRVTVGTAPPASVCRRQLCRSQAEARRLSPPRRVPATHCATCVRLQKTALRHFFTLALPSENVPDQSGKITSAFRE